MLGRHLTDRRLHGDCTLGTILPGRVVGEVRHCPDHIHRLEVLCGLTVGANGTDVVGDTVLTDRLGCTQHSDLDVLLIATGGSESQIRQRLGRRMHRIHPGGVATAVGLTGEDLDRIVRRLRPGHSGVGQHIGTGQVDLCLDVLATAELRTGDPLPRLFGIELLGLFGVVAAIASTVVGEVAGRAVADAAARLRGPLVGTASVRLLLVLPVLQASGDRLLGIALIRRQLAAGRIAGIVRVELAAVLCPVAAERLVHVLLLSTGGDVGLAGLSVSTRAGLAHRLEVLLGLGSPLLGHVALGVLVLATARALQQHLGAVGDRLLGPGSLGSCLAHLAGDVEALARGVQQLADSTAGAGHLTGPGEQRGALGQSTGAAGHSSGGRSAGPCQGSGRGHAGAAGRCGCADHHSGLPGCLRGVDRCLRGPVDHRCVTGDSGLHDVLQRNGEQQQRNEEQDREERLQHPRDVGDVAVGRREQQCRHRITDEEHRTHRRALLDHIGGKHLEVAGGELSPLLVGKGGDGQEDRAEGQQEVEQHLLQRQIHRADTDREQHSQRGDPTGECGHHLLRVRLSGEVADHVRSAGATRVAGTAVEPTVLALVVGVLAALGGVVADELHRCQERHIAER